MEHSVYYNRKHRFANGLRFGGWIILGVGAAVLFAFLFGYFVMLLWNWLMPMLFGLKTITYWQAFGIVILAKILFGSHGHREHDNHPAARIRQKVTKHIHNHVDEWKYYNDYWNDEGKNSFEKYVEKKKKKG